MHIKFKGCIFTLHFHIFRTYNVVVLSLCGALSTFVSSDLDVAQEYLPRLTQQLEEETEATSGRPPLSCYVPQGTIHYKTAELV
jgi:hypothetical protein